MKDTIKGLFAAAICFLILGIVGYCFYDHNDFVVADRISAENVDIEFYEPNGSDSIMLRASSNIEGEICFWSGDEDEATIEPNEPECTHPNLSKSTMACATYHGDGLVCIVCPDCNEYVSSEEPLKVTEDTLWPEEPCEPITTKDLLTIVKDIQVMIGNVVESNETVLSIIGKLQNIDSLNMNRIQKIEQKISTLDSLKLVLLAKSFDINGKEISDLSADKRIELCQKIFDHMNEKQADPNDEFGIMWSNYWIGDVHIEIEDFDFKDD